MSLLLSLPLSLVLDSAPVVLAVPEAPTLALLGMGLGGLLWSGRRRR